jgi:HlyD family type I secretion membrane fusion protein
MTAAALDIALRRGPRLHGFVIVGALTVGLFFGGFGAWAALAPLSGAVVAPGQIQSGSDRKTVQHLEGGIIAEIRVREGDRVQANDVLVRLDDIETRTAAEALRAQLIELASRETRLMAERDGTPMAAFDAPLLALARTDHPTLAGQVSLFDSRWRTYQGQIAILEQRIAQSEAHIRALTAQVRSAERQMVLIREETASVRELVEKGLERRPRLLALEREAARLEGERGESDGLIVQARQAIVEARMEISALNDKRVTDAETELRDVQLRRAETTERLAAAEARLDRTAVLAPQDGIVLNLRYVTPGGVITAGAPILDLVPAEDNLAIEARVRPIDVDEVAIGQTADVRLVGLKQRVTPTLTGRVMRLSADTLADERTGESYYEARVEIPAAELDRLGDHQLGPGMPAEVMILTGERTLVDYLVQPIMDSFARALREG